MKDPGGIDALLFLLGDCDDVVTKDFFNKWFCVDEFISIVRIYVYADD